jgi:uncharacterized protein (DUF2141 family)
MIRFPGWVILGVALAPAPLAAQSATRDTGTLQVTVTGIRTRDAGSLLIALYDRESAWLTLDSARMVKRIPAASDSVTVTFDSLTPDSGYAIAVIHDRNGNDRLDMRWFPFPKPKEGAGVSNNHLRMGKPKYEDARFAVHGAVEYQRIELRY